ncbi:sodium-dependent transporter [Cerasibacillus terrae]|uniref:Sodium-dependent transporter n=1 Tax=Cerasibacillus terrae TaxID=2498845 RepID=A0A5C8NTF2_9BACI|nr:sodium-dependent transporter [Cerasibacillus terrae]TXL64518.1 sodium-dependent transporter [Cerasibacillus terrae]
MKGKKKSRENWGSRLGFIMATAGFSIGLGNIWRFSYVAGHNGGGAFLLIYLLIIAVIGIPIFLAETGLGRKVQTGIITGLRQLTRKGSPWVLFIGWLGILAAGLIMSYYLMIMGWIFAYIFKVGLGTFNGATTEQIAKIYEDLVSNPLAVIGYTLIPTLIIGLIVSRGVKNGIEKFVKISMPILLIMLILLAIYSLSLPGSMDGVVWYLKPDFSVITPKTFLEALGQVFFSLGIGLAGAFTYGSYLDPQNSDLVKDSVWVISFDTTIAFLSGLVIFPALFAFQIAPDSGPGLLFLTIPNILDKMPGGTIFGMMFFILVIIAAITTAVGLIETVSANTAELLNLKRKTSVWLWLGVMFILAIPSILSHGPWAHIELFSKNIFELIDYVSGNILLVLSGLFISLYVVFKWKFQNFQHDINIGATSIKITAISKPVIQFVIPIAILIILVSGLL